MLARQRVVVVTVRQVQRPGGAPPATDTALLLGLVESRVRRVLGDVRRDDGQQVDPKHRDVTAAGGDRSLIYIRVQR